MGPSITFFFVRSLDLDIPRVALGLGLEFEMSDLNQPTQPRPKERISH
jgi:hypothetical protein